MAKVEEPAVVAKVEESVMEAPVAAVAAAVAEPSDDFDEAQFDAIIGRLERLQKLNKMGLIDDEVFSPTKVRYNKKIAALLLK